MIFARAPTFTLCQWRTLWVKKKQPIPPNQNTSRTIVPDNSIRKTPCIINPGPPSQQKSKRDWRSETDLHFFGEESAQPPPQSQFKISSSAALPPNFWTSVPSNKVACFSLTIEYTFTEPNPFFLENNKDHE